MMSPQDCRAKAQGALESANRALDPKLAALLRTHARGRLTLAQMAERQDSLTRDLIQRSESDTSNRGATKDGVGSVIQRMV